MSQPVVVVGGSGMLGSAMVRSLADSGHDVRSTIRDPRDAGLLAYGSAVEFDVESGDLRGLLRGYGEGDFVVNSVGIIKPYIHDDDAAERRRAIAVNSAFPYRLAALAEEQGFRVVQIATDCVFSGTRGAYRESDPHDAWDVYGKSKSLGEVPSSQVLNLRSSIIGPELKHKVSLLEWVLGHDAGSQFTGYTDHRWNGVTTAAFGRVVDGVIRRTDGLSGTFHLVPFDIVTKDELSRIILEAFGRHDVDVIPTDTGTAIDRTLATDFPALNDELWAGAGYSTPPRISELVGELAAAAKGKGSVR